MKTKENHKINKSKIKLRTDFCSINENDESAWSEIKSSSQSINRRSYHSSFITNNK